jgi:hypothetical protein
MRAAPPPTATPPSLLPIFRVLVAILAARLQSLLLVLLGCGVAIATVIEPTTPRLVALGMTWLFILIGIGLLEWFAPRKG